MLLRFNGVSGAAILDSTLPSCHPLSPPHSRTISLMVWLSGRFLMGTSVASKTESQRTHKECRQPLAACNHLFLLQGRSKISKFALFHSKFYQRQILFMSDVTA